MNIWKNHFIYALIFSSFSVILNAEVSSDSIPAKKRSSNFYAPFHETIDDTFARKVSKLGCYLSFGFGPGFNTGMLGINGSASISLAYKSHLLSLTRAGNGGPIFYNPDYYYQSSYTGLLFGESVRLKYLLLSLSAGIALTSIIVKDGGTYYNNYPNLGGYSRLSFSFPVEYKVFLLAPNGIGIGSYLSCDILAVAAEFSPFSTGFAIVFGMWNRPLKSHPVFDK